MSAPVIHNTDIPAIAPAPGAAAVISWDYLVVQGGITADPGDPLTLVLSPAVSGLKKNGNDVGFGSAALTPGDVLTWQPSGASGQVVDIASFYASVQFGTSIEIATIRVRVPVPDTGQEGPYTVAPGTRIDAAELYDPNGPEIDVTVRNEHGDAVLFTLMAGDPDWWSADMSDDPDAALGLPPILSNVLVWDDAKDTGQYDYGAAVSNGSLQLLTLWGGPNDTVGHSIRDLTAETGAPPIFGELDKFVTIDGLIYVVGNTVDGDLVIFHQTGAGTPGHYQWVAENLSEQFRARGEEPQHLDHLVPYVTAWNGLNIAGLDSGGNIWSVWTAPGMDHWEQSDLTAISGAPQVASLAVYLTPWGGVNLVGNEWWTGSGQLIVTWWVPSFGGNWVKSDFNDLFGFENLRPSTVTSYVTPWNALNITGVDAAGRLHIFWWEPTRAGTDHDVWTDSVIQPGGANPFATNSRITALVMSDQRICLFGTDATGQVVRAWWKPDFGPGWQSDTLA